MHQDPQTSSVPDPTATNRSPGGVDPNEPSTERIGGAAAAPAEPEPPTTPKREIDIGTVLSGRYLIERAIGSGGMSTVFSALDRHRLHGPAADAKVAVKVLDRALLNDKARVQRLIREFRYMQRLTHRGIVRVFDLDCDDGTWFITMELLHGQPLSHYLQRHQPEGLSTDEALRILIECTRALVCAHDYGVIHGDLKPGNVFIDDKGVARLLDFGSVPEPEEDPETARDRFLTPAYASPQMLENQVADLRDDLFSLGCMAYELFSGKHPYGLVSSVEARRQKLKLTWTPSIPARHFGVIARMLSWNREDRPANGREFLDSLTAAQARAKAAFIKEPKDLAALQVRTPPVQDAPQPVPADAPAASTAPRPQETHREPPRHAVTDAAQAFAKFAGVVPPDWVGHGEDPAAVRASVEPPNVEAAPVEPTPKPAELAKERWSKAIPPEWLEPKAKIVETPAVDASAASPEEAPEATSEAPAKDARATPWLSQLRWSNARVLERIRQGSRMKPSRTKLEPEVRDLAPAAPSPANEEPSIAAREVAPVQPPQPEPVSAPALSVDPVTEPLAAATLSARSATEPAAVVGVEKRPAPRRIPQLHWRTSTPATWSALAQRLRTLRIRSTSRATQPALSSLTAASNPQRTLAPGWTPQLEWRDAVNVPWRAMQSQPTADIVTHIKIGTPIVPPVAVSAPTPAIIAPAIAPETSKPAIAAPRKRPRVRVEWRKNWAPINAFIVESHRKVRASLQRQRKESFFQHWSRLRQSIASLTTASETRPHSSLAQWLTERAPRWREAVPAVSIVGIAVLSLGLLQISDASRFMTNMSAERTRLAALRLQALADSPIAMSEPQVIELPMPAAPLQVAQPPSPPAAPGSISFQSARVKVSSGQQMAVVNLRRYKSTAGSAPFGWRIAPGTARPGVDYEQPKIQVARFNDGQDVRSLFIPIKPAKDGSRAERRFTIELTRTPGGPAFGDITETEVVIEGSG